jgi:hypothetical protein
MKYKTKGRKDEKGNLTFSDPKRTVVLAVIADGRRHKEMMLEKEMVKRNKRRARREARGRREEEEGTR